MASSNVQSPSKQSFTFELGGATGSGFGELDVAAELDVGGALGVVDVVGGAVVAGADGGWATGASPPQPARSRARAAKAMACRRMHGL
ncbi:hypothetical protein [Amycolatopsis minnesotensis]|uniref:hypothetical protein n=1 Tax=Amycolatopsis minnesotensis TaxID=337894 RepID=UPI0031DD427B